MQTQRLEIENRRGQTLVGVLHGEVGQALVISCHGMLSTKDGDKHQLLAKELTLRNTSIFRFDFAGRGESAGSLYDMSFSNQVEDLDAVINYFWKKGVTRLAVFGSSMGGAVALLAAARDERISAVATLAAVGHPEEIEERYPNAVEDWKRQGYYESDQGKIASTFLEDALSHSVVSAVRILRIPVFVVHGEDDDVVPVADAHDIATACRKASLELVPGADHRFSNPVHLREAMRKIADFLADAVDA